MKCKVLSPRGLHIPVLPYRSSNKLLFGLCRTCAEGRHETKCQHNDDQGAITGTWVTDEVKMAIEKGYQIL